VVCSKNANFSSANNFSPSADGDIGPFYTFSSVALSVKQTFFFFLLWCFLTRFISGWIFASVRRNSSLVWKFGRSLGGNHCWKTCLGSALQQTSWPRRMFERTSHRQHVVHSDSSLFGAGTAAHLVLRTIKLC
jgi:hypothetical protein